MGIDTVAVYSDADVHSLHVTDADQAVHIGGAEPAASYLSIDRILEAARATRADAIHPGYGFLSENAAFARACAEAGVIFIGPSPAAIELMGSKLESKRVMDAAGVPTLPSVEITRDLDIAAAAEAIGYPVLVKASAGGGGKGMRIVRDETGLRAAVDGAAREAVSAFGDGTVFLEKYIERPRHVEIQVLGDTHGAVVHLFERECSIQRRHQKVVEEAPSPAVDPDLRDRMGVAAIAAANAVEYVGAGTVEFLLDPHGDFYFLEMNTRLQVEHPVTEAITGLDLVRLQIQIAQGEPLPAAARSPEIQGHGIEARLYAEDPANGYLPVTGRVAHFALDGVRVDTGVGDGSEISIHYDPMIAKVVAHGATRSDAIRRLARALRGGAVHGLATNLPLLVRVLESDAFAAGDTDTEFLDRIDPVAWSAPLVDNVDRHALALAAALAGQAERRNAAQVLTTLPSGWRNSPSQLSPAIFDDSLGTVELRYRVRSGDVEFSVNGDRARRAELHAVTPDAVDITVADVRRRYQVRRHGSQVFVQSAIGSASFTERPLLPVPQAETDPGSLLAPMPGKVVRVTTELGETVGAGEPLIIIEAMKMEHTVAAPIAGIVTTVSVREGDQVDSGQVLAHVDEPARDAGDLSAGSIERPARSNDV